MTDRELAAVARTIVDANLYMTLGTVDEAGNPWVSPVYYAHADYRELYWVSQPEATHSRNLAARPGVSIVVFDSHTPIGNAQAVYMAAAAEELDTADRDAGIEVFSRRSLEHGGTAWSAARVESPAPLRLYRATVSAHWVLDPDDPRDRRIPVTP